MMMILKKNKWEKLVTIFIMLSLILGFGSIITPGGTAYASEEVVFTVEINGVEEKSYTLSEIKAMPATTKTYGSTGYYERKGVDFFDLLESLNIDYDNWTVKLIMTDAPGGSILNFSNVTEPLLAYEESVGGSAFAPIPLKLYHGDGTNHKLVYQNVVGINVIKPDTLTPPAFEADSTDNTVGKSIDLTFKDDETWRAAITEVTVNGSALESDEYTVEAGKLTIDGSAFTEAGDYEIVVKATEYEDVSITQVIVGEVMPDPDAYTVSFSVKDSETTVEDATIEVQNSEGEIVTAEADGNYKLEVGDYTYTVIKEGFKDVSETFTVVNESVVINISLEKEAVGEVPPVLTASTSGNTAGNPVLIKYTDPYPQQWEPVVTAVFVDGVQLESWQYNIGYSKLTIAAGIFNEVKDYTITVEATGYQDATVTQTIETRPELFVSEGKGNIVSVAGRVNNTVSIKNDGTVWAWGDGQGGKLGDGTTGSDNWRSVPGQVSDLTEVTAVAPGESHTLALKNDGTVWAWGSNSNGVLGNENISGSSSVPVQVITDGETGTALTDIKAIAAGNDHSLALKEDGTVWAWGSKRYGQLGDGKSSWTSSKVPVQVITDLETGAVLTDIKAISAGKEHSLALKSDGTVWAWGRNYYGQLGNGLRGSSELSAVPVLVMTDPKTSTALTDVTAISAGQSHSFALKNDGTVWAWGWNNSAQLGNGSTVDSSVPVQVVSLTDIQSISAGANHVMALKNDNTIWVWGSNYYGQLGIGANTMSYIPTQLCEANDIAMINAGYFHSMAVKSDGTVWTWGQNTRGKLGNGTTEKYPDDVPIPTQVRLAPQAVVPAVESAILGDAVELGFTDDIAWRESITAVSVDGIDLTSEQYTVEDGKIIIVADAFAEAKEHIITIKASGFLDVIVAQQIVEEADETPKYNVIPKEDPIYTIGETADGIKIMTVNDNQTGLNYFAVSIESIEPHEGTETVIFTHIRDGVQLQLNALEADFDKVSAAKAGFNVKPGDVIKVYIVDKLTNDNNQNPVMLQ